ncbi:MAG: DNA starvation/stationary phase protection protein [Bacteroidetes bacterium RIFCSPLOWO2_12_FULL_35_15]|nr:MAG: DNA starvation/stationary phase protection protein [Bacteroidetes bacterium RIFCSPLOWO2_12_FULL_35_15]
MKAEIGISENDSKKVSKLLTEILSDAMVLLVKTKNFHWNITGQNFSELHAFFQSQYAEIEKATDDIAERIRSLGYPAIGAMKEFLNHASIKECKEANLKARDMLKELVSDHESIIKKLREAVDDTAGKYKDAGTSDFLTGLLQQHEKMAWMTRSYL